MLDCFSYFFGFFRSFLEIFFWKSLNGANVVVYEWDGMGGWLILFRIGKRAEGAHVG